MILFEDLPELAIELAYISSGGADNETSSIFILSMCTTVVHLIRSVYELRSLHGFLPKNRALDEAAQLCNQSKKKAKHVLCDEQLELYSQTIGKGVWESFNAEWRIDLKASSIVQGAIAGGGKVIRVCLFGCMQLSPDDLTTIFEHCHNLEQVWTSNTNIDDACVKTLVRMCNETCTHLALSGCPNITRNIFPLMTGMLPNLCFIALSNTLDRSDSLSAPSYLWVTDSDVIPFLRTVPLLKFLALCETSCTDETFIAAAELCPRLETVGVNKDTTDEAIFALVRSCKNLKRFGCQRDEAGWVWNLEAATVSEEAKKKARELRPNILI